MKELLDLYAAKLTAQGLCDAGSAVLGGLDAELCWNTAHEDTTVLAGVIDRLNINSILYAPPAEPYRSIMELLCAHAGGETALTPGDSETRTFLHDIPIVREFSAEAIASALKRRKSALVPGHGIVTFGTVSPEQAFVSFSSVCFAMFVKFFCDYAEMVCNKRPPEDWRPAILSAIDTYLAHIDSDRRELARGPFRDRDEVIGAMIQAGGETVRCRLVDSFFGNISCLHDGVIYISQTGSSLDALQGCIDPCPAEGGSCAGITASSEYSAHREIYTCTDRRTILHGHPRFCVIMSMLCSRRGTCETNGQCHLRCPEERSTGGIPIVPGEVGTGTYGLCNTMPPALAGNRGVIVYGHGLFTAGEADFTDAFRNMVDIESMCVSEYRTLAGV